MDLMDEDSQFSCSLIHILHLLCELANDCSKIIDFVVVASQPIMGVLQGNDGVAMATPAS